MANVHLLPRLGTAPLAAKYLATRTARLNWQSVACGSNKVRSYPKTHGVSFVKDVKSLQHLETDHVFRSRHVIKSYRDQQDRRKLTSQDVIQVTTAYKWKPKNPQKGALFGHQGYDLLTYFTSFLGSLTQPVRHKVYTPKYPVPDKLEPWRLPVEPLGTTFPSYLGEENVEKIRILAQAEFDKFSWSIFGKPVKKILAENQSRKLPERFSEDKIFGLPLDLLMKKDVPLNPNVPRLNIPSLLGLMLKFLHKNGLNTKGILKAPESSTKVKKLKEDIETNFYKSPNYDISNEYDAHDVAAALKDFIAELQKPLLTTPVIPFFHDFFSRESEHMHLMKGLNLYFLMMSPEHRDSLQMILVVLHALTQNSAENGLTVQDCAEIFWPVFFSLPPDLSEEDTAAKKKQFFDLTRVFVHYNEFLFTVPPIILNKMRRVNKAGLEPSPIYNEALEHRMRMDMIIIARLVLTSPEFKDGSKHLNISTTTTAEDVVAFATGEYKPMESLMEKLKSPYLGKNSKTSNFLFENGGNLGYSVERVLDPKTKVLLVWRENSSGKYIIKTWKGYNVEMLVKVVGEFMREKPLYEDNPKDYIIE
ncbi:unnamed protein product [Lymnaea stagnalis]|uniref:Rho-GAP domain-containing protein n=1 Tax=Lymnaea stagnalis TaxID=6523 RepID=A0AAV2HZA8_LYMST